LTKLRLFCHPSDVADMAISDVRLGKQNDQFDQPSFADPVVDVSLKVNITLSGNPSTSSNASGLLAPRRSVIA